MIGKQGIRRLFIPQNIKRLDRIVYDFPFMLESVEF
jgi:hypothetical protein